MWSRQVPDSFFENLRREKAMRLMQNNTFLRSMRYDHEFAKSQQRCFGRIWEEYGTNIYKLIAKSCGECWDNEDDEKYASVSKDKNTVAINQSIQLKNDHLATTCQESSCRGKHKLQRELKESERELEEDKSRGQSNDRSSEKEKQTREKKERRRAGFYRRAGGT